MTQEKKAETSYRPKFDPAMDGPTYQIFKTRMESGFLDPTKVEREALQRPDRYKKDLDYERAYHVEELPFRGYDRSSSATIYLHIGLKRNQPGKPKVSYNTIFDSPLTNGANLFL